MAEVTGGRFYRAVDSSQLLGSLREILSRESRIVSVREEQRWIDLYRSVLAASAVFALVAWALRTG